MLRKSYSWWFGLEPRITIINFDLIKQVLTNKEQLFTKSQLVVKSSMPIIGKGLVTIDGEEWAFYCQIVNPTFHHEKVKVPTKTTLQIPLTNLYK
jgi:cytokinin trans-hydroxylase